MGVIQMKREMLFIQCDKIYIEYFVSQLHLTPQGEAYILHYMRYAIKKCKHAKYCYYFLTTCTIVLPILFTMLQGKSTEDLSYILPWLAAFSSIAAAMLPLLKVHEKWTRYRGYVENVISILMKAQNEISGQVRPADFEKKIIDEIINLNAKHHQAWKEERKNDIQKAAQTQDTSDI